MKKLILMILIFTPTIASAVISGGIGKIKVKKACECIQDSAPGTDCSASCKGFSCYQYVIGIGNSLDSCNCYSCGTSSTNLNVPLPSKIKAKKQLMINSSN